MNAEIPKNELAEVLEAIEEIYNEAVTEHRRGNPDKYWQGKKDGLRVALALINEAVGKFGEADKWESLNTKYEKEGSMKLWLEILIRRGFEATGEIHAWANRTNAKPYHPLVVARNRLVGQLSGAYMYLYGKEPEAVADPIDPLEADK